MLNQASFASSLPNPNNLTKKLVFFVFCTIAASVATGSAQNSAISSRRGSVPKPLLLRILMAEDERRWDDDLRSLMTSNSPAVRGRAALAAGRIGREDSVAFLSHLLESDKDAEVRAIAAFAIGETESISAADALVAAVQNSSERGEVHARAIEALGKIAAALPKEQEGLARQLGAAILGTLEIEAGRGGAPDRLTILLGLTAVLRSKPANAGPIIVKFLLDADPRIRADAANALARLRNGDGNSQLRKLLTSDADAIVRANAARVLGATEDKTAFDGLLDRALNDADSRVRVSAIRAIGSLKDGKAAEPLLRRYRSLNQQDLRTYPSQVNEVLEIATTLGRILPGTANPDAVHSLREMSERLNHHAPEVEVAFARVSVADYLGMFGSGEAAKRTAQEALMLDWKSGSGIAQGLGEIASLPQNAKDRATVTEFAQNILRAMLDYRNSGIKINTLIAVHSEYAIPDVLRALAAFKPKDLPELMLGQLNESDVIVRATAAELLGDVPPSEAITRALSEALPRAMKDELNDAALAILDSLGKQKSAAANTSIKTALDSNDHLLRRKAVALLKANGAGDFSSRIGTVRTRNTMADYQRAVSRIGTSVQAVVSTTRGRFTIELLPDDATLTVDNFVQLAKRGYFNGITFHRVVPNFVIQDGDPRGDGNGGPGYQIRCEINEVPYDRAAVGMALSGKDTGGSQWFVTHSPQPHLDGGYTVFGRVLNGMDVVDNIVRGDVIQSIVIVQRKGRAHKG